LRGADGDGLLGAAVQDIPAGPVTYEDVLDTDLTVTRDAMRALDRDLVQHMDRALSEGWPGLEAAVDPGGGLLPN
jgi:hypothetical protein